ncbi:hypothetical protein OG384_14885 [Streptomyces sp. NBC_01324]|uniref:hypothetical protein n=1 Tax=Streptomyces sp. NBC_01324 TaxID=2903826 RepID=UPI002E104DF2|nr:hypothetical protein OG384_14885 [Streptomyces sp. NBC_01324]
MTDRPITPTRIIPAGAPLPGRLPLPGELPPWWEKPAAAPAPPPPPVQPPAVPVAPPAPEPHPAPQVHVHVVMPYEPEPELTRRDRLAAALRRIGRPWQICGALLLAVLPIPGTGYSSATTWAYATNLTRTEWGAPAGYALALVPLLWVAARTAHHGGTLLRLWAIAVTLGGLLGALDPFDVVTAITGVHR